MRVLYFILYLIAAICFLLAVASAMRPYSTVRTDDGLHTTRSSPLGAYPWMAMGLLAWVLVPLIVTARAL